VLNEPPFCARPEDFFSHDAAAMQRDFWLILVEIMGIRGHAALPLVQLHGWTVRTKSAPPTSGGRSSHRQPWTRTFTAWASVSARAGGGGAAAVSSAASQN
jgi:hypothetical protein